MSGRRAPGTRLGLAWVLALLLHAAPAAAQSGGQNVEAESARFPGWSFTPSMAVGALYDSNVALRVPRTDLAGPGSDAMFNVIPAGQLEYFGRRTEFSTTYRGFLRRYVDVDVLNSFDQRASMSLKHAVSRRLTVFARDSFADSPTTDEVDVNGVPFGRIGSQTNTFAASADYRLRKLLTWSARYDNTWVSFDRSDLFLTGGWIHGVRNELSYTVKEHVTVGGEYSYRTASLDERRREFSFQDVGGVVRFVLGPRTRANAAAGFATLHDRNRDETRTGPFVRLGIEQALDRATLGASFERQYVPSFGFGGASNSQELRGYVQMPLRHRRLSTNASAVWRQTSPFEVDTLELDTVWLSSTLAYTAARWLRIEGVYTYARQDALGTGGEIKRHRIGVQFVISQPMRIQ
jgi:hypothetical protein